MIPMSCPSCGRRGNVPLDRLNTRMHCKKCDAVFYLDATGKPVLGEPPSARAKSGGKGKAQAASNEPLDPIGIVATKIASLPRQTWYGVGGLLGIFLIYQIFMSFKPPALNVEDQLNVRMQEAAKAYLDKDTETLRKMAATGTEESISRWLELDKALLGNGVSSKSADTQIIVGPPPPMAENAPLMSSVSLLFNPAVEGQPAPDPASLDIFMVHFNDQWYLDFNSTAERAIDEAKVRAEKLANKGKRK